MTKLVFAALLVLSACGKDKKPAAKADDKPAAAEPAKADDKAPAAAPAAAGEKKPTDEKKADDKGGW